MKDVLQKSADNYEPRGRLDPVGFERHVSFLTYLPPADLAPFIDHFWTIRWDKAALSELRRHWAQMAAPASQASDGGPADPRERPAKLGNDCL